MCKGISRHLLDENWAVREKIETGSTFVLPAIRTLCLFNVIQNFCLYWGHLTVDAGNALEMLFTRARFFGTY
jgi:hypothetical protein